MTPPNRALTQPDQPDEQQRPIAIPPLRDWLQCAVDVGALDDRGQCKHYVSVPHVLVRDVPDDVHAALQRRAEQRHQSLQQYLAAEFRQLAERRSVSELLDEIEGQQGGRVGFTAAVSDLEEERSRR